MGRTSGHPTLATVAGKAGVSLKTASRALNDEPNVAPGTRARVRDVADRLGFRRNAAAADLARGGASRLVGFVSGDLANPFYSALASGIERELRAHGLQLITASSDEDPERERILTRALVERRVGALVVTPAAGADDAALRDEVVAGVPVVFVDRPAEGAWADTVVIDNRGGVRRAMSHLLAQGHRRIGFVGDVSRLWTFRERRDEFVAALRGAGIADPDRYVRDGAHDADAARRLAAELLALPEPPTALLATNNKITVGVLHALEERGSVATGGVRVPGEAPVPGGVRAPGSPASPPASEGLRVAPVALVGFDDFELADLLHVTVVAYDAVEMGRRAAALAISRAAEPGIEPRFVVVPTRLVVRGSGEVAPEPRPV